MNNIIKMSTIVFRMICMGLLTLSFTNTTSGQDTAKEMFYIGTGTKNVHVLAFDRTNKKLETIQTVETRDRPTFLDVRPDGSALAVVCREGIPQMPQWGSVASYTVDQKTGEISMVNEQTSYGKGPCHITFYPTGGWVIVSHYVDGLISVLPMTAGGKLAVSSERLQLAGSSADPVRQTSPHTHSSIVSRDGSYVYVSDLGIDKVMVYKFNSRAGRMVPAAKPWVQVPGGAGPRHFTLHQNGELAFLAEEISSTLHAFRINPGDGTLQSYYRKSTLPSTFKDPNKVADIHLHPSGDYVYVSNRGHNSIAIFEVSPETGNVRFRKTVPSGGNTPRNFFIDPKGEFALVANKDSNVISYFGLDQQGNLIPTDYTIEIQDPMCIKYLELKQ